MTGTPDEWRWVDPNGIQSTTDKWELVSLLSSSELPYYSLVWRPGWAEWLPACRVEELAQAIGEKAEPPVQPRLDGKLRHAPPPPLYKYHAYLMRESPPKSRNAAPSAPGTTPPSPRVDAEDRAPTEELGRRPLPTLMDEPEPSREGGTLRPPAAVPPPPRSMPRGPAAPAQVANLVDELTVEEDPSGRHSLQIGEPTSTPAALTPVAPRPEPTQPPPLTERKPHVEPPPQQPAPTSHLGPLLFVIGLVALLATALGAVAIVALLSDRKPSPAPVTSTSGAAVTSSQGVASAPSAAGPAKQCLLARGGRRLYGAVDRTIPPLLLSLPDHRVGVGFASNETTAVGLSIDVDTMTSKQVLLEPSRESLCGVVPIWNDKLRFAVDRATGDLRQTRTIGPGLVLGMTDTGLVRREGESREVLWQSDAEEPTTPPRTASIPGRGHVVTFRRGDQQGAVLVGWLRPDGTPDGAFRAIPGEGLSGTPSVAQTGKEILVSFASRPDPEAKWGVTLAHAAHGEVPKHASPFVIPPGGPGVEAMAPAATGLDDGRWLLQWTEGSQGNRQVRVQTLTGDLVPIGDAITLSAVEDNAGQGVVHAVGNQVLSLFLVIRSTGPQLWAASLKCD